MPTWGELLNELKRLVEEGEDAPHDRLRRGALHELHEYTGRNTILYASAHLQKPQAGQPLLSIHDEDVQGFMEAIYGLDGDSLDLILHSPGGTAEAADSLVQYLRQKFDNLRVIVPQMAMSAATMLACASDRIIMARHSKLGPVDPQLLMQTEVGVQLVPAQAILDQFDLAKKQCEDEATLAVWYPILRQYGPALLMQCKNAIEHSRQLVGRWLEAYMFRGEGEIAREKAERIARDLSEHREHLSHSRPLGRDYLRELGLVIDDLEEDQELQDRVLTVFHATNLTLMGTAAAKVIENHEGRSFIKMSKAIQVARPPTPPHGEPEEETQASPRR